MVWRVYVGELSLRLEYRRFTPSKEDGMARLKDSVVSVIDVTTGCEAVIEGDIFVSCLDVSLGNDLYWLGHNEFLAVTAMQGKLGNAERGVSYEKK